MAQVKDNRRKFIPSVNQLKQDVTSIYIDVNLDYNQILMRLEYHLDPSYPDNIPDLTYELILQRYRAHIDLWNRRHGERETRGYLKGSEAVERKNFLDFLEMRLYTIDWTAQSGNPIRDRYLFGEIQQTNLTEQRKCFLENLKVK